MSSLRQSMNEIKERARMVTPAEPFEWELRDTVRALATILSGKPWRDERTESTYEIDTPDHRAYTALVTNGSSGAGILHAGLINALRWLVVGIDPDVRVTNERILDRSRKAPGCDCPFCMGTIDQCIESVTDAMIPTNDVRNILVVQPTVRYDGCEHLIGVRLERIADDTLVPFAYFAAYDMRLCDVCERYNPDDEERCQWCDQDAYADSRHETERDDD